MRLELTSEAWTFRVHRIELLSVLIAVSFSDQSPGCSPRLFRIWKKSKTSISDLDMRCYRG
ncbi:hypothetical protein ACE6H2_004525 [Prunus campanulata]